MNIQIGYGNHAGDKMIQINDYGNECVKCKNWVNPHEGFAMILNTNTFHKHCLEECIPKLVKHINHIMDIEND